MSTEERGRIAAKVAELEAISLSDTSSENQKSRLGLVANMLMAYPMSGGSEEAGRARAGAYLSAIDDIPPWAIAEAVRRWHRGEGPVSSNFRFAPAPAELRFAAMQVLQPAKQTIAHLTSILNALTIEEAVDPRPIESPPARSRLRLMP